MRCWHELPNSDVLRPYHPPDTERNISPKATPRATLINQIERPRFELGVLRDINQHRTQLLAARNVKSIASLFRLANIRSPSSQPDTWYTSTAMTKGNGLRKIPRLRC